MAREDSLIERQRQQLRRDQGGEGDEFCRRISVRSGKFSTSTTIAILAPLNVVCFVGD